MIPNASDLARRRHTVVIVLRMLAIIPAGLTTLIAAIGTANILQTGLDRDDEIAMAVTLCVGSGATILAFFVLPAFAGVFVPRTRTVRCPFCDYDLKGLTEPRCTECGNPLTPEFLGRPPAHAGPGDEPPQVTVERRRSLFAVVVRLLGVAYLLAAGPIFLGLVLSGLASRGWDDEWTVPVTVAVLGIGPGMGIALFGVLFPGLAARWIVPRLRALKDPASKPQAPLADGRGDDR